MSVIDDYFKKVDPAHIRDLERIRTLAKKIVPDANEIISYSMPTLTYHNKPFLGFNAHKKHIGIYPYSGQVVEDLKDDLNEYGFSSGAIRVPYDSPIPEILLKKIIMCRLEQIDSQK